MLYSVYMQQEAGTVSTPPTYQSILEDPDLDPALFDRAEGIVIRKMGRLTRTTTPTQWEAYWRAVADQIKELI